MQKLIKTQKVTAMIYIVMAIIIFLYSLCFMTEYSDLFGLMLKTNSHITNFYKNILQKFNWQIFRLSLGGIAGIVLIYVLEIMTKVVDKFALIVIETLLLFNIGGCGYSIMNLNAIQAYYKTLDFQYIELEGVRDYVLKFTAFNIGNVVYVGQIIVSLAFGIVIAACHIKFVKCRRENNGK